MCLIPSRWRCPQRLDEVDERLGTESSLSATTGPRYQGPICSRSTYLRRLVALGTVGDEHPEENQDPANDDARLQLLIEQCRPCGDRDDRGLDYTTVDTEISTTLCAAPVTPPIPAG